MADLKTAVQLLVDKDSLLNRKLLNQASSQGLTPIEYALANRNMEFLEALPDVEVVVTQSLVCTMTNLLFQDPYNFETILNWVSKRCQFEKLKQRIYRLKQVRC